MHLFHKIEEGACILLSRGVFKQVDLYQRNGDVYAAHGSGFISLRSSGGTSVPSVSWEAVDVPGGHTVKPAERMRWTGFKS